MEEENLQAKEDEVNNINANNKQQAKLNNNRKFVIAIITLIIVGLVGYIIYTNFIHKDEDSKTNSNNTEESTDNKTDNSQVNLTPSNQETTNYSDWISYILNQSNISVKAIRYDCGDESNNRTVDLTIEQLKAFFDKNKDNELVNFIMDGTGDSGCGDYLLLSYSVNGKTESLEIQESRLWNITDNKLYDILTNSNIRIDDTECTAENKECYSGYYGFNKEISFDEYFK